MILPPAGGPPADGRDTGGIAMKTTSRGKCFSDLDRLTRQELIARLLGMRAGASVEVSRLRLQQMRKDHLRVLFLLSQLYRAARARREQEEAAVNS